MPSRPPETEFYENDTNHTLWRTITRDFEDFCGDDEAQWPDRYERFAIVLKDVLARLVENTKE